MGITHSYVAFAAFSYYVAIFPEYRQKHLAERRSWVSDMRT